MNVRKVAALGLIALVCACSKQAGPSILGHWQAERVSVFSAQLPVGPDIVVSEHQISSPDNTIAVPIKEIERTGDTATVDLAYGVGLSFYFDGPDRMYLKVPVLGRVYYRRVMQDAGSSGAVETAAASESASANGSAGNVASTPVVSASQVAQVDSQRPRQEPGTLAYNQAVIAASTGKADVAIADLNDAFKAGFRNFSQLDSTLEFTALKADVRYQAMVARYR